MEQRKAQVGQFVRDAEAAGRRVWNDATRAGEDALGRTQSELAALGAPRLRQKQRGTVVPSSSAKPGAGSWLDHSPAAKTVGGKAAVIAGNVVGLGRGVLHSAEGMGQGLNYGMRLLNPAEAQIKGPAHSALGRLTHAASGVVDYVEKGIAHPSGVASDVRKAGHQLYVDTVPSATPMANTFGGEMARNFNLGANQGELGWDMGSLLFAGAGSKVLRGLGATAEASGPAKFVGQGLSPEKAEYLAAPYEGRGHHYFPQNAFKPIQLPQWLSDSIFNVLKPNRTSRGDFYELHYRVDPRFWGAGFPASVGGGGWSGKRIGLEKYGPGGRLWNGSPAALNAAAGAAGAAGVMNYGADGDEEP
jgi:hypothetical protein